MPRSCGLLLLSALAASCGAGGECGNGVLEEGEACDLGEANADDATCKTDCTPQTCGDGAVGAGEPCDGAGCECTMLWARTIDGVRKATGVAVTANGRLVLAGERMGGASAIWVRVADPEGNEVWTRARDGGQPFDRVLAVAVDPLRDQVTATGGEVFADSGEDLWAERHGPGGETLWVATHSGAQDQTERGLAVATDRDGNALVLGSEGPEDLLVRKLAPDGAEVWTERISSVEVAPMSSCSPATRSARRRVRPSPSSSRRQTRICRRSSAARRPRSPRSRPSTRTRSWPKTPRKGRSRCGCSQDPPA